MVATWMSYFSAPRHHLRLSFESDRTQMTPIRDSLVLLGDLCNTDCAGVPIHLENLEVRIYYDCSSRAEFGTSESKDDSVLAENETYRSVHRVALNSISPPYPR